MLPRQLYELLPYIYIVTGIVCVMVIDSTIVLISSILLIVTGIFVLIMRRNFRKSMTQNYELTQAAYEADAGSGVDNRSGIDRRQRIATQWPTLMDTGEEILSDRRIGERRASPF